MSTVYINIGFPGSGKSTMSNKLVEDIKNNIIIINRDSFRTMIKGGIYTFDFKFEPFIKQATNKAIECALEYGLDIIVDETHIKRERRMEIIKVVKDFEASYGLVTDEYGRTQIVYKWYTENKHNLKYRMRDARGYETAKWAQVINGMKKSFEEPTADEGYDRIEKINPFEQEVKK